MGAYEDQIIANANAIQQIINQAKLIPQLPDLDETLGVNAEIPIYDTNGVVTGKINLTELADIIGSIIGVTLGWRWIESSNVEKDGANSNNSVLEVNDEVYFKKITNNGDPVTLVGWTYNGGDKQLITSYSQNQAIVT
jgi:hypothetical protein